MDDDTDWTLISFERPKKAVAAVEQSAAVSACPKCGKPLGRGGHFHVKHCKGVKDGEHDGR